MIDEKKIEVAAAYYAEENTTSVEDQWGDMITDTEELSEAYKEGAKWAIYELLKDLLHPASEVPRNDNGKILAFSKVNSNIKLYDMNAMLDETACDTYQEMWEIRVRAYTFTDWVFVDELLDLITKGGNHD